MINISNFMWAVYCVIFVYGLVNLSRLNGTFSSFYLSLDYDCYLKLPEILVKYSNDS